MSKPDSETGSLYGAIDREWIERCVRESRDDDVRQIMRQLDRIECKLDMLLLPRRARSAIRDGSIARMPDGVVLSGREVAE